MACIYLYKGIDCKINDNQSTIYYTTEVRIRVMEWGGEQISIGNKNSIDSYKGISWLDWTWRIKCEEKCKRDKREGIWIRQD